MSFLPDDEVMAAKQDTMLTLDLLPHEVIEHVLSFPEIDICDLCRCSEVCSTFREVICSNDLWKKKFARR